MQVMWSFSIFLEAAAILPQLFMLTKTGEAENITSHYLFALGSYRALYLLNWIDRYYFEGHWDPIAVTAGVVQTVLYADFFYLYFTRGACVCVCACVRVCLVCCACLSILSACQSCLPGELSLSLCDCGREQLTLGSFSLSPLLPLNPPPTQQ